jgi:cytochrome c
MLRAAPNRLPQGARRSQAAPARGRILRSRAGLALAAALAWALGCGPADEPPALEAPAVAPAPQGQDHDLTAFELEHGIGPIAEEVKLGPVDPALAARGEEKYTMLCESCHRLEDRFVGPPLGEVLARRSPTYVLNMMLNPQEMVDRHPVARQLLAEYLSIMPNQQLSKDDARAILEYLRTAQLESP